MSPKEKTKQNQFSGLEKLLSQNKKIDLRSLAIKTSYATLDWKGLEDQQTQIISQLKAYQRILKILSKKDPKLILNLLQSGVHSAIQIASIPKQSFMKNHGALFSKKKITAGDFYDNALAIKNRLLLKHVQKIS